MSTAQLPVRPRRRSGLLITAATLMGVASVAGLAGFTLGTVALVAGLRRRIERMEVPPGQIARQRWAQTRTAVAAGVRAWRGAPAARPVAAADHGQATATLRGPSVSTHVGA